MFTSIFPWCEKKSQNHEKGKRLAPNDLREESWRRKNSGMMKKGRAVALELRFIYPAYWFYSLFLSNAYVHPQKTAAAACDKVRKRVRFTLSLSNILLRLCGFMNLNIKFFFSFIT